VTDLRITIPDDQLAELEARITARVLDQVNAAAPERLLTVDQLADMLGTTPEWVRRHQRELGAYRLSDGGGRNPIRFRVSDVERFLAQRRLRPPARAGHWRDDREWALRP
jgi:hypothetical protein